MTLKQRPETGEGTSHEMIGVGVKGKGRGTLPESGRMQGSDFLGRMKSKCKSFEVAPFLACFMNKRPEEDGQWG